MSDVKLLKKHADLFDRMGGVVGLDLEELVIGGELSVDEVGEAVLRCTGCADPEGCDAWLGTQDVVAGAAKDGCRNARMFAVLKAGGRV